jgi:carbonic anhydrase/acetyltransferase-like protein (isoleucine patch superfamily)
VLHAPPGIHGADVGAEALIANHATVLDGAVIGARSSIAAHALVVAGTHIPD